VPLFLKLVSRPYGFRIGSVVPLPLLSEGLLSIVLFFFFLD